MTATALMLSACGGNGNDNDIDNGKTVDVNKPGLPVGLGYELYVAISYLDKYPLPAQDYLHLNDGNGHFNRDENPVVTASADMVASWIQLHCSEYQGIVIIESVPLNSSLLV